MLTEKDLESIPHEELLAELKSRQLKGGKAEKDLANSSGVRTSTNPLSDVPEMKLFEKAMERQKVIYGVDDRREIKELLDGMIKNNADSVVGIFDFDQIVPNGDGTSRLVLRSYQESFRLCSNELFSRQPVGPSCTGFLIAPDLIATAGHCIDGSNFLTKRFVFGFEIINGDVAKTTISDSDIFEATAIVDHRLETAGSDYAIVKLDRPVAGHNIVTLNSRQKIRDNERLYVIGHPSGLPKKFADGAVVRDNTPSTHFVSNLDTYGGNSGSPVFNANTHEVEGILVRGENDFVLVNGCARSQVCPTTGCRGEDVTRVSEFINKIPKGNGVDSLDDRMVILERTMQSFKNDLA